MMDVVVVVVVVAIMGLVMVVIIVDAGTIVTPEEATGCKTTP